MQFTMVEDPDSKRLLFQEQPETQNSGEGVKMSDTEPNPAPDTIEQMPPDPDAEGLIPIVPAERDVDGNSAASS